MNMTNGMTKNMTKSMTKSMKRRVINVCVWVAIAAVLLGYVCMEWHAQGCGWQSLVMACGFYGALSAGGCIAVDDMLSDKHDVLREQMKRHKDDVLLIDDDCDKG